MGFLPESGFPKEVAFETVKDLANQHPRWKAVSSTMAVLSLGVLYVAEFYSMFMFAAFPSPSTTHPWTGAGAVQMLPHGHPRGWAWGHEMCPALSPKLSAPVPLLQVLTGTHHLGVQSHWGGLGSSQSLNFCLHKSFWVISQCLGYCTMQPRVSQSQLHYSLQL